MSRSSFVEPLEGRQLLASVGPVIAQQFVGGADACTAVVLHFDQPLDPTTAENPDAYELIRKFNEDEDGGFGGGLGGGGGGNESSNNRIRIESADYDDTNHTVTLTTVNTVVIRRSFTVIVVHGRGQNAVLTPGGAELDGDGNGRPGGDAILRFKTAAKKTFSYRDADGDRAKITLTGAGRLFYLFAKRNRSSPVIFLRDTVDSTIISGTVKQGRRGDGIVNIAQLNGSTFTNNLTDPPFSILPDPVV
jgi:hypothetical protein